MRRRAILRPQACQDTYTVGRRSFFTISIMTAGGARWSGGTVYMANPVPRCQSMVQVGLYRSLGTVACFPRQGVRQDCTTAIQSRHLQREGQVRSAIDYRL